MASAQEAMDSSVKHLEALHKKFSIEKMDRLLLIRGEYVPNRKQPGETDEEIKPEMYEKFINDVNILAR